MNVKLRSTSTRQISPFTLAKNAVRRFRSTINVATSFCVQEKDGNRAPYLEPMKAGPTIPAEQVIFKFTDSVLVSVLRKFRYLPRLIYETLV